MEHKNDNNYHDLTDELQLRSLRHQRAVNARVSADIERYFTQNPMAPLRDVRRIITGTPKEV